MDGELGLNLGADGKQFFRVCVDRCQAPGDVTEPDVRKRLHESLLDHAHQPGPSNRLRNINGLLRRSQPTHSMRRHRGVGDDVVGVGLGVEVAGADEVADAGALVCEVMVLGV
jgi:hypothetical protein